MNYKEIKEVLKEHDIKNIEQLKRIIDKGIYYINLEEICDVMCPCEEEE